jgi:hypothetical protein
MFGWRTGQEKHKIKKGIQQNARFQINIKNGDHIIKNK